MIGGGGNAMIGPIHLRAALMDDDIELVAGCFSRNYQTSLSTGEAWHVDEARIYHDYREMMEREAALPQGERMDFVAIVTPNRVHYEQAALALDYGFDVVIDKPMTFSLDEALRLEEKVEQTGRTLALTHTYSAYPAIKEMKSRIAEGQLGRLRLVYVEYTQGWLSERIELLGGNNAGWRTDPSQAGKGGCVGDIGTHAWHLTEYVTGLQVEELCAEMSTVVEGRPNDDNISGVFATFWNIPMYGMDLEHTGGNMMEDGRGHGVSDELVFQENNYNEENVRQKMRDYLGIDPYHVTIDPQGDYIAHVDCWGKYLAPDKILIARLPQGNSHYADYESVAEYFATTNCCWGYPYKVYRVEEPGGNTLAPYTNSLILNKSVYVPLGSNSTYNQQALAVYQEAMPGYEIVGVYNNDYSISWENTDALHCRTRGVMDFDMLFVDHRNVIFGEQEWQDSIAITSKFIAYSGQDLKQDSLLVYYSIDGGEYQVAHMTATGNPDEYVGYIKGYQGESEIDYYVFGADESGHRYQQPVFGELDPHHFTMEAHEPVYPTEPTISVENITFDDFEQVTFTIINETANPFIINSIEENPGWYLCIETNEDLPATLEVGGRLDVTVELCVFVKGYVETTIEIVSDLGTQTIAVNINEELLDDVGENNVASFEVYPNPMNNTLYVNGNVQDVTIFNAVGQQVLFIENRTEIDVTTLNDGLYFVRISDSKGNSVVKKIVKR